MATKRSGSTDVVNTATGELFDIDSLFNEADEIDGLVYVQKSDLVDTDLVVIGAKLTTNKNDVQVMHLDVVTRDGKHVAFVDSSKGVKAQIEQIMAAKELKPEYDTWFDLKVRAPQGLRVSEYDFEGQQARTFYLTTSGKRG